MRVSIWFRRSQEGPGKSIVKVFFTVTTIIGQTQYNFPRRVNGNAFLIITKIITFR